MLDFEYSGLDTEKKQIRQRKIPFFFFYKSY
jgi:hypothetical protein